MRALQWETDIDFENNLIQISKTKDRYGSLEHQRLKSSYCKFPINENTGSILLNYKSGIIKKMMATCVFRNPQGLFYNLCL